MDRRVVRWYMAASWAVLNSLLYNHEGCVHPRRGTFVPWADLPLNAKLIIGNHYNALGRFD
jgi:hypothetical protein